MELRDMLVCLDPTHAGEARLRLAAEIARACGAVLSAAFLLPEAIPGAPPYRDGRPIAPPTVAAWMPNPAAIVGDVPASGEGADVMTDGAALAAIIEERFREEVRSQALEGDWHRFGSGEASDLTALVRTFDLVVYGQESPDWRLPTGFRPEDMIVAGGRPFLVVPYAGRFAAVGRRVLLAWDGTREAARALHDALPLIARAEAATIMTVRAHETDFESDQPLLARVEQHLARHGVKAAHEESVRGDVPVADLLLSRAADLDADLIVAGAYHHSQFREALLGGVSRDLLDHMTVPVLLSH
ncbi:MAG TPA: universal stress protein [Stellaceae bacterium]|nr:universal stress protein [Stellaceae bacterium]